MSTITGQTVCFTAMDNLIHRVTFVFLICLVEIITEVTAPRPYINDEACPRKPELALHRKCLKKCRTDLDCRGRSRHCLCDDVCGKACVKPSQKCEQLKPLFHGHYQLDAQSSVFGARVRYTCDKFYTLSGPSERVCQGDGYWSGKAPTCVEQDQQSDHALVPTVGKCYDPPEVPHAVHDGPPAQTIYPLGTQLNYRCQAGYNIDGFFRSMCVTDGRWVGPRMTCSPRRCGHPGDIEHGRREGNAFVYPNRVTYRCQDGFELQGRAYRVCQASGQWSGVLPNCIPTKCPRLDGPEHGEMLGTDNTYGARVEFSCSKGYTLDGSRTRRCEHSGKWSGHTVTCTQVDCGQPGPFYNGFLEGGATTYGAEYKFRCFGWTTFEGPSLYTTCLESGLWSHPVPMCWGRCMYPSIVNGTVTNAAEEEDDYGNHGDLLRVICDSGNELNTTETARCHNGTWTFVPQCVPSACKDRPMEIQDGFVRFYTMNHGDKARYKCNTGHRLKGSEDVTCQYGEWIGSPPICEIEYCPFPGTIENGELLLVGVIGKYNYPRYVRMIEHNQVIEFHCNKEYKRMGPGAATCVDGRWSPPVDVEKPKCIPKQHPKILYLFRGKRSATAGQTLERVSSQVVDRYSDDDKGLCEVPSVPHAQTSSLPPGYYVPHGAELRVTCLHGYSVTPGAGADRCRDGVWNSRLACISGEVKDLLDMANEKELSDLAVVRSQVQSAEYGRAVQNRHHIGQSGTELAGTWLTGRES